MLWVKIASLFLMGAAVWAESLPAGTALPVMLDSTLKAESEKPGRKIEGKLMQDVSLPSGSRIKVGAHITGSVVSAEKSNGAGWQISVRFIQVEDHGTVVPLNVYARAVAAMESVAQAQQPTDASSNYESENQWSTRQVGGERVDRSQGYLVSGKDVVGKWVGGTVVGRLQPNPARGCTGSTSGEPQALWIFSTTACGLYGSSDMKLSDSGKGSGTIVLESSKDVLLRGGSGWLLIVK